MRVIIPMAGTGNRFVEKGYTDPKPLIKVNNKRIIEYILDMFNDDDTFIFICNEDHLENTEMRSILTSLCPGATIVSMPTHKEGPVVTVKAAYDLIEDEEEVLVCYCDNPLLWDYENFKGYLENTDVDGCILTHTGFHPHTLSDTKMAFLKIKEDLLEEIKEKECYTSQPMTEEASTGIYYFRNGKLLKTYFDKALEKELTYNGEYYVTLVYNLLVEDGLKVGYYTTPFVTVFGTPEEVENFEAWTTILRGDQVKSTEQLNMCAMYWRDYHRECNIRGHR